MIVLCGAVLRLWEIGRAQPIVDEAYTLVAVRMPLADMVGHLDATDPHPPLAYVVLRVAAILSDEVWALRAVSATAGIAAVVVMAVWRRTAGIAGLVATGLFALAPYQLGYVREVRMYGLLSLAGVTAAWCTDRWLTSGRRRWAFGAVAASVVVAFSHAVGVLLLLALLVVPLRRVDRSAVELRVLTILGLAGFAAVWGHHALEWSGRSAALPTASLDWVSTVVNELVAPAPSQRWIVLPLLLGGAVATIAGGGSLRRVWLCLFAVPLAVLYLASLRRGVLVPRSLMPFSWAVPIALGSFTAWSWARARVAGAAVVVVLALAVVPLVGPALDLEDGSPAAMAAVFEAARVGDGFAYSEDAWPPDALVRFHAPAHGLRSLEPAPRSWDGVITLSPGGTAPTRIWYLAINDDPAPAGAEPCSSRRQLGEGLSLICLVPPAPAEGGSG